jgi:hypothetical protein
MSPSRPIPFPGFPRTDRPARRGTPAVQPSPIAAMGLTTALAVALAVALGFALLPSLAMAQAASGGYTGFGGTRWSTDYGIGAGRCDRDAIVIEANDARKTLVQRHEENLKNRTVGIIGATSGSGVLLSTRLGGRLDDRDRHCLGHVLELGAVGREVTWINPTTRQAYVAVVNEYAPTTRIPTASGPKAQDRCRVLVLTTTAVGVAARGPARTLVACQANPGVWSIR